MSNNEESLARLVYASTKGRYVDGEELKKIMATAKVNNGELGVTGVLIFNSQFFLQALEGTRDQITSLFNSISKDERHKCIQLISMRDIDHRCWAQWSMRLISITEKEEKIYAQYSDQAKFNPFNIASDLVVDFLKDISKSENGIKQ